MKKSELFILIKSLSKSEKRYFKMTAKQMGSSSNYVRLFDEMDKQEVFDEKAIRQIFAGEKFTSQLHVTKNYLRQLILKSLRNYHHKMSKDAELKDVLRNIEILFNKELFEHCSTEMKRAEQLAKNYELKTGMVEVLNWKRKLEQALRPHNYGDLKMILEEQDAALQVLKNAHEYWQLAVGLSSSISGEKLEGLEKHVLLEDAGTATSLEAKVLFYNALYVYHMQKREPEKAAKALHELIDYLEKRPHRLKEDPAMYISSVNNLLSYYVFLKKNKEALALLRRAKKVIDHDGLKSEKKSLLKQVLRMYNIELELYRSEGNFAENAAFIKEVERFVLKNKSKMPADYLISFWFQFSYIHFMREQYNDALKWVNLILNSKLKKVRPDLQTQTRLLNLMVHLEQRNLFVLRYFVDSTKRYLKKMKKVHPHEKILLAFFSKMGKTPGYEWGDKFKELEETLFPENGETVVPESVSGYIDYEKWIAHRRNVK